MDNEKKSVDVVIVGGGAAGISAALWCDELGLKSVLIEVESGLGGQLHKIYNPIENYPGIFAADGKEMLSLFEKSLGSRNFDRRIGIKATSIDFSERQVTLAEGGTGISYEALILATGVRRRLLGIPGEAEFIGKGILESGSRDKNLVSGKRVMIVGGADAAFENAVILSEVAESVSVVLRGSEPTARREFVEAVESRSNTTLIPSTVVTQLNGNTNIESAILKDDSGSVRTEQVDAVLIRVGVEPNSEIAGGALELDDAGYIKVDHQCRTSVRSVYAAGDVAANASPTLSTATGTAATAVKTIFHSFKNTKGV